MKRRVEQIESTISPCEAGEGFTPTFIEIEGLKKAGADVADILKDIFPGRKLRSIRRGSARLHQADPGTPIYKMIMRELADENNNPVPVKRSTLPAWVAREQIMLRDRLRDYPSEPGDSEGSSMSQNGEKPHHHNGNGHGYDLKELVNTAIISSFKGSLKP